MFVTSLKNYYILLYDIIWQSHDRGLLALEGSEFNYHAFNLEFNLQHFCLTLFNLWRHLWWHFGVISVLKLMHSFLFIFFAIWTFSVRQRSQYLLPLSYILHFWSMSHLIVGSGPSFSRQTNWERAVWCFIFSFLKEALWFPYLSLKSWVAPIYICSFPCIDRDAWYTTGPVLQRFFNTHSVGFLQLQSFFWNIFLIYYVFLD